MYFLKGEAEACHAWDTAAVDAQRQRLERIAAQVRLVAMRGASTPYKNPRTGREKFELSNRRPTLADFPLGWEPCSAKQLYDALAAGWKPAPSTPTPAYGVFMAGRAGY